MLPEDARNHSWIAVREWDAAFLLPRKAASSSIKRAIRRGIGHPNIPPDMLDYVSRGEAAGFTNRIGVCRHPLTRLASCYADKFHLRAHKTFLPDFAALGFRQEMTFAQFVERVCRIPDEQALGDGNHFRSQIVDLCHGGKFMPTRLCRFESLAEDWREIRRLFPLPKLHHLRRSDHSVANWTERTRRMAVERYRHDFEVFGYAC